MSGPLPDSSGDGGFGSTDWGLIATAREGDSPPARRAMADLCATYWYPLYAFLRRRGYQAAEAQDLTQGLFASLLARDFLHAVGPEKGKFRTYLLACLQNYLANQRDRDRTLKRGGGCVVLSIDLADAEGRFAAEPSHELTAEKIFERRWAITLLGHALERLGTEMVRAGKGRLFDCLRPALLDDGSSAPYSEISDDLGLTEAAVKMAARRIRQRFRKLVREEVACTVADPEEVDDEIRELFAALGE